MVFLYVGNILYLLKIKFKDIFNKVGNNFDTIPYEKTFNKGNKQ